MADTPTKIPIATTTIAGTSTSSVTYSSLGSYTDIVLVINGLNSSDVNFRLRMNGDTGSNYSVTRLEGDGTSASSSRETNQTNIKLSAGVHTNTGVFITQIMNFSNSTTYKTVLTRSNIPANAVTAFVGCWRNTNAVTSLTVFIDSGYIVAGTTITLYGIL
jgi:hypothetical protein